jgi:hypothetical protein
MIRIDYTCKTKEDIKAFILKSISSRKQLCLYNKKLYINWLLKPIESIEFKQLVNKRGLILNHELLLIYLEYIKDLKQEIREAIKKYFNI